MVEFLETKTAKTWSEHGQNTDPKTGRGEAATTTSAPTAEGKT